jgi:hypothetical protein
MAGVMMVVSGNASGAPRTGLPKLSQIPAAGTRWYIETLPPASGPALDLAQAWRAMTAALGSWRADAQLVEISSLGDSKDSASSGTDGRRLDWEAQAVSPSTMPGVAHLRLSRGVVTGLYVTPTTTSLAPLSSLPALTTAQALAAAKQAYPDLAPGDVRNRGYAYSYAIADDGKPVLSVLGDEGLNVARVDFDALTGERLRAWIDAPSLGGVIYSDDGGATWRAASMAGDGQVMTLLPATAYNPATTFRVGKAGVTEVRSTDQGRHWSLVEVLPAGVGRWLYAAGDLGSSIVISTEQGLWASPDHGTTWSAAKAPASGRVQWIATLGGAGSNPAALVASVPSGPEHGIYQTTDLRSWRKVVDGAYRLSTINGGEDLLAENQDQATGVIISAYDARTIDLPVVAMGAAGELRRGGTALVYGGGEVFESVDGAASWHRSLAQPAVGLASTSDPGGRSLALVGGTPGVGVFRRLGSGGWVQTLPEPGRLLPGDGEMSGFSFFGRDQIVAVEGSVYQWLPW